MSCNVMPEVDIFQRTLKCHDIPRTEESEIEIFEVESMGTMGEEEALPGEDLSELCDPEGMYGELECLKRRIQKLLVLMKAREGPCPLPMPPPLEATCCQKNAICLLQKQQHVLQQEINKLIQAYNAMKSEIHDLHAYICKQSKDIEELQLMILFLQYWQRGLKPDEGVCHQRYVYIKDHKADWADIEEYLKKEQHCTEDFTDKYVLKNNYESNNVSMQAELEKLKSLYVGLFETKRKSSWTTTQKSMSKTPLKQIEIDYIKRQVKKNRKLEKKSCQQRFKCDKIDF